MRKAKAELNIRKLPPRLSVVGIRRTLTRKLHGQLMTSNGNDTLLDSAVLPKT